MKLLIKENDSHTIWSTFDTFKDSDSRRINVSVSILQDRTITQQKTATFYANNLEDAIARLEACFEFESEEVKKEIVKPLVDHFASSRSVAV
jgi:hypothetical protein